MTNEEKMNECINTLIDMGATAYIDNNNELAFELPNNTEAATPVKANNESTTINPFIHKDFYLDENKKFVEGETYFTKVANFTELEKIKFPDAYNNKIFAPVIDLSRAGFFASRVQYLINSTEYTIMSNIKGTAELFSHTECITAILDKMFRPVYSFEFMAILDKDPNSCIIFELATAIVSKIYTNGVEYISFNHDAKLTEKDLFNICDTITPIIARILSNIAEEAGRFYESYNAAMPALK